MTEFLPPKKIKRIHVNQHKIRANINRPEGQREPVLAVRMSKGVVYGNTLTIYDRYGEVAARILYRPDDPLDCGARVWIETNEMVSVSEDTTK